MGINRRGISTRMGWHIVNNKDVAKWVAEKTTGLYSDNSPALGLLKDGQLICGVSYDHWNGRSIFANMVVEGRMSPAFVAAIFDYAFNVCNAEKIIVSVVSNNERSIRLAKKMGFIEEARIKNADPNGDFVFLTLAKDQCKFLEHRYGKRIFRSFLH